MSEDLDKPLPEEEESPLLDEEEDLPPIDITPDTQNIRRERVAVVIAVIMAGLFHLFILIGGIQLSQWMDEEEKKERIMVIRRVAEATDDPPRPSASSPARVQSPPEASHEIPNFNPPSWDSGFSEGIASDISEEIAQSALPREEVDDEIVSVVTDLSAATFTIGGAMDFFGSGTFWTRSGLPVGRYRVTFHPVPGYRTPPIQRKTLAKKSKIVFVGKYTKSVEVKVDMNEIPGAAFEIYRPDGVKLGMNQPGRAIFENLPPGNYTIVYSDVPGYLTPGPQTRGLGTGGGLNFTGSYLPGGGSRKERKVEAVPIEPALDRRVQMVVKSYPYTRVEKTYDYIPYPEVVIRRSNFQSGWCRVYLVLTIDGKGLVERVHIERPKMSDRKQYAQLVETVERSVRRWRYDRREAEIHVDVRFYVE